MLLFTVRVGGAESLQHYKSQSDSQSREYATHVSFSGIIESDCMWMPYRAAMPSSSTAARLFRPDVSRLPVNLSHRTCTTVDCRLLLHPKNSCTWTTARQKSCTSATHLIPSHFTTLKCTLVNASKKNRSMKCSSGYFY